MKLRREQSLILMSATAAVMTVCVGIVVSLRNDDSMLSIILKDTSSYMGWGLASTTSEVLQRMSKYEKKGRYDDAIEAGVEWTKKHPTDGSNDRVFIGIASTFLHKAKQDSGNADEYVRQAVLYRDKAIPIASDTSLGWYSLRTVRDLALISESAGDLSDTQRCVQYRNAAQLLERLAVLLNAKRSQLSNQTSSAEDAFGSNDDVERFLRQADATLARVRDKQQSSACQ
jgi:hypothetical protein